MKVVTWNINALGPTLRNIDLRHGSLTGFFLGSLGADIICLQETKLIADKLTRDLVCISDEFESFWASSQGKLGYSGVVTYVRKSFSPVHSESECIGGPDEEFANEGRSVLTDHGSVVVLNLYVPNAGGSKKEGGRPRAQAKMRFLYLLQQKVDQLLQGGRKVIVCGDLNVAASQQDVHQGLDYKHMYSAEEKRLLAGLLEALHDSWRSQHPDTCDVFTVWDEYTNARVFNRGVRIDYILVSHDLVPQLGPCEVLLTLPPKWSDHAPVELTLPNLAPTPPHPPCPQSSHRHPRFSARAQPSVASLFARSAPRKRAREDSLAAPGSQQPVTSDDTAAEAAAQAQAADAAPEADQCGPLTQPSSSPAAAAQTGRDPVMEQQHQPSAASGTDPQQVETPDTMTQSHAAPESPSGAQVLAGAGPEDSRMQSGPSSPPECTFGQQSSASTAPRRSSQGAKAPMHAASAKSKAGRGQRTIVKFFSPTTD